MMYLKLSILFVFWGLLMVCGKKINKNMWYTKIELEHNPYYLNRFVANLSADRVSWNLDADVARDLTDDLWLQILLSSWQKSTSSYQNRLKYDINVYDLLRKGMNDKFNLLFMWLTSFWKSGTLPMEVPFRKGIYHWRDVQTDRNGLPTYLFQGTYRFDVMTYFKLKKSNEQRNMFMNITMSLKVK